MKATIYFTVGIIFTPDLKAVYLLRKDRPKWQAGLLNGVGGKVEPHETFLSCMEREAREEAGYAGEWVPFTSMKGADGPQGPWRCEVYYSVMEPGASAPYTCEREQIEVHPVADLVNLIPQMVPHLPWLILAALNHHRAEPRQKFNLQVWY